MPTYTLKSEDLPPVNSRKALVIAVFSCVTVFATFCLVKRWLWTPPHSPENIQWIDVVLLLVGASIGWAGATRTYKSKRYELTVNENEMRSTHLSHQCVRRGEVRTIIEKKHSLCVSRRSRIGMLLHGGVWIPKTLPEYESLKNLALSWKTELEH